MAASSGDCPNLTTCRLYPLFSLAGSLSVWKTNYCTADYTRCVRFQRACDVNKVPDNLLPNGQLLNKPGR